MSLLLYATSCVSCAPSANSLAPGLGMLAGAGGALGLFGAIGNLLGNGPDPGVDTGGNCWRELYPRLRGFQ